MGVKRSPAPKLTYGFCHQHVDVTNIFVVIFEPKKSQTWLSVQTTPKSQTRLATCCRFNRFHVYESPFAHEHLYGCGKMEIFENYRFQ